MRLVQSPLGEREQLENASYMSERKDGTTLPLAKIKQKKT